jgi:hypothetical protein
MNFPEQHPQLKVWEMIPVIGKAALAWQSSRGGRLRQQRAREALQNAEEHDRQQNRPAETGRITSELVAALLKEWSWGEQSAAGIQRLCMTAYNDQKTLLRKNDLSEDLIDGSLQAMAKLGSWGRYSNNCQRDLLRWLGDPEAPAPFAVEIPIKVVKPGRLPISMKTESGFLLPHEEFANLFANHKEHFDKFIRGEQAGFEGHASRAFWQSCIDRNDPRLLKHPILQRPDWKIKGIPIAIHGDGVACVNVGKPGTKSMDAISWASVLSAGTTLSP